MLSSFYNILFFSYIYMLAMFP